MGEYDGISQFLKAAPQRLRDAEHLLKLPRSKRQEQGADERHLLAAMYLAGYAVECILKAYIISRARCPNLTKAINKRRKNGEKVPDIGGKEGHNLTVLLSLTDIDLLTDSQTQKHWLECQRWKSNWRYVHDAPKREEAEEFIGSIRFIYQSVQSKL